MLACLRRYLLLHYKMMVLRSYYKRTKKTPPANIKLDSKGIGLTGVGDILLEELFTLPEGLPPELVKAIEEFTAAQRAREARVKELRAKAAGGGVKGMAAKNELIQL